VVVIACDDRATPAGSSGLSIRNVAVLPAPFGPGKPKISLRCRFWPGLAASPGSASSRSAVSRDPVAPVAVWARPVADLRAVGGDQATPDTVLADVPVPQRQRQALAAYQAGRADGDRRGRLLAGLACLGAEREPLVRIKVAASTPGVPGDLGPRGLIGEAVAGYGWGLHQRTMCSHCGSPGSPDVHVDTGATGVRSNVVVVSLWEDV
jgi:hypothetical protein